jgi:hypothetical protein
MPGAQSAWDRVCTQVEEAHVMLLKSVHRLEDALMASGAEPRQWSEQVGRNLAQLIDIIALHRDAVAVPGGLIGLIELHGRSRGVTALIATHDRLLDQAHALRQLLDSATSPEAPYSPVRRDAALLAAAVRAHEAEESALIYETNVRVSGGEG